MVPHHCVAAVNKEGVYNVDMYLMNSLTNDERLMMLTLKEQYHVNNIPDGILLLKFIIGMASIDTKAKVLHLLCVYFYFVPLNGRYEGECSQV
jgi:hypothetical protein